MSLLDERIEQLDAAHTAADAHAWIDPDLVRVLRVLGRVVPGAAAPVVTAEEADELVARSSLVSRLRERAPEITDGPLSRTRQYWVAGGRPPHLALREPLLDEAHFARVEDAARIEPSTKPFEIGLYTSTGVFGSYGMWWCFLHLHEGSTTHPRPWTVWSLQASSAARVLELRSASDWAAFVRASPVVHEDLLYPDWRHAATRWDAVHVGLGAVVAMQGCALAASGGAVAPSYWDMESTLWLRWAFDAVEPVVG